MKKALALPILISIMAAPTPAQLLSTNDNILFVDVSKVGVPVGQYGMGFIKNSAQMSPDGVIKPNIGLMKPVIPRIIRSSSQGFSGINAYKTFYAWNEASIATNKPIIYQFALSDDWHHQDQDGNGNYINNPYTPGRDAASMAEWLGIVDDLLRQPVKDFVLKLNADIVSGKLPPPKSKNLGEYFHLDLWNEPAHFFAGVKGKDEGYFYSPPNNEYYLAFLNVWNQTKHFVDVYFRDCGWCKDLGPGPNYEYSFTPQIVGPSFSGYNSLLRNFYLDTKAQGTKPDFLSWHSLDDHGMRNLESQIGTMKALIAGDQTRLCVNEWVQKEVRKPYEPKQDNPAIILRFLSVLERQEVLGSKSCWTYTNPANEEVVSCENASLSSFLTSPDSDSPRSAWWTYERFNRLSGNQLSLNFLNKKELEKLDGVAAFDSSKSEGWVLVGNYDSDRSKNLTILFKGISTNPAFRDKTMSVDHEIIENSGLSAYPSPKTMYTNREYTLKKNTFALKPLMLEPGSIAYFHFKIR